MFRRCPLQDAEMSINLKSGLPLVLKQLNNVSPEHGMWYLTNCYCTLNTCKFIINYQKFRGLGSIYGINLWFRSSSSLLIRENIGSRLSWHWYALCVNLVSQGAIWSHIFWSVTTTLKLWKRFDFCLHVNHLPISQRNHVGRVGGSAFACQSACLPICQFHMGAMLEK